MSPGEEFSGEGSIEKISLNKELENAMPEYLNHRLEYGERNIKEGSFIAGVRRGLSSAGRTHKKTGLKPVYSPRKSLRKVHVFTALKAV